jgi:hypothetical protein
LGPIILVLRRTLLWIIWLAFVGYVLWLNPWGQAYPWQAEIKLLPLQLGEVNSYLVTIFWLMGIWALTYGGLMFADGVMQKLSAWPFF